MEKPTNEKGISNEKMGDFRDLVGEDSIEYLKDNGLTLQHTIKDKHDCFFFKDGQRIVEITRTQARSIQLTPVNETALQKIDVPAKVVGAKIGFFFEKPTTEDPYLENRDKLGDDTFSFLKKLKSFVSTIEGNVIYTPTTQKRANVYQRLLGKISGPAIYAEDMLIQDDSKRKRD